MGTRCVGAYRPSIPASRDTEDFQLKERREAKFPFLADEDDSAVHTPNTTIRPSRTFTYGAHDGYGGYI